MQTRNIEAVRGLYGVSLLLAPRWTMSRLHLVTVDRSSVVVGRVLGARQLSQAILSGASPSPEVLAAGVWVDLAHAATAVGLATVDRSRLGAGVTNAAASLMWAGWGWRDLHHGPVPDATHQRTRDRLATAVLSVVPGGRVLGETARARRQRVRTSRPA